MAQRTSVATFAGAASKTLVGSVENHSQPRLTASEMRVQRLYLRTVGCQQLQRGHFDLAKARDEDDRR